MKSEITLGVVGVRNVGMGHCRRACALDGVKLLAVADTNPERRAAAKEELGVEQTYASADDLLARDDIDAVVLALPNHLHEPLTVKALEAGKHVLVEKPMSRTVEEAERMLAARDRSGKTLMVGMNQRFSPAVYAARAAILEGRIGEVQYTRAHWTRRRLSAGVWQRGDWFLSAEKSGGGPLLDIGVHKLDLALHLIGFPAVESVEGACFTGIGSAEAASAGKAYGVEDSCFAMMRLAGGGVLYLESSYFLNMLEAQASDVAVHGTRGGCVQGGGAGLQLFTVSGDDLAYFEPTPVEGAPSSCVEHFRNVLRGSETLSSTPEQGRDTMAVIEAIYESARTGERVSVARPATVGAE